MLSSGLNQMFKTSSGKELLFKKILSRCNMERTDWLYLQNLNILLDV